MQDGEDGFLTRVQERLVAMPPRERLFPAQALGARGRVRLRTLSNLRWLAVAGQTSALFLVDFGFGYPLPLASCATVIAASVALNLALALRYLPNRRLTNRESTFYLGFDVLQLAALLYLTGGIENPFSLLFIAPVVIAATTLNLGNTLILAAVALASICAIGLAHEPLPWAPGEAFALPPLYLAGIWASLVLGIGFTTVYAWRIASESARMSAGLAATQLALSREHRLSAIGALATAAAHELGTPLGTIAVVSRELERALPPNSPEAEDARLLREQAERCRAILARLANPEEAMVGATTRLPLGPLLDDMAQAQAGDDIAFVIEVPPGTPDDPQPQVWRAPEVLHGLGNLIENAADFAKSRVRLAASWNREHLIIAVEDDGPGFDPEIMERIGEPYVTSRPGYLAPGESDMEPRDPIDGHEGMGLGFFIAKTLLEQTGGAVTVLNLDRASDRSHGARVQVRWLRGVIDGEYPPGSRGAPV